MVSFIPSYLQQLISLWNTKENHIRNDARSHCSSSKNFHENSREMNDPLTKVMRRVYLECRDWNA